MNSFQSREWIVNTEGNKHHRQVHQPFLFIYFFTGHQGRVYFVIKLAQQEKIKLGLVLWRVCMFRLEVPNRRKIR